MSMAEAVLIIQRHERARQGRLRAKYMRDIRSQEEAEMNSEYRTKEILVPHNAAIIIQKVFGFRQQIFSTALAGIFSSAVY